ncbi:MAG: hypothetical protein ABIL22_03025 [candidate division WOR-3 bacterium]
MKRTERANRAIKKDATIAYEIGFKLSKVFLFDCHFRFLAIYAIFHFLSLFEPFYPFI